MTLETEQIPGRLKACHTSCDIHNFAAGDALPLGLAQSQRVERKRSRQFTSIAASRNAVDGRLKLDPNFKIDFSKAPDGPARPHDMLLN